MAPKAKRRTETIDSALSMAIEASGVAEVVRSSLDGQTVKVLYRVREKRLWLGILEYVLSRADGWTAHVCQQYFMRGGRLVYGWNFILQPTDSLEKAVENACGLLVQAAKVVPKVIGRGGPLESFPLVGASPRRTAPIVFDFRLPGPSKGGPSHKGAYAVREEKGQ